MQIKQITIRNRSAIEQLLMAIPFYRAVKEQSPTQFDTILYHSCVAEFEPGEVVLRRGERATWLFFLLRGTLDVEVEGGQENVEIVNQITPGEVFGDVAMLAQNLRVATVRVPAAGKPVTAFATNCDAFGPLEQFHPVSLETKLAYYRNTVHNLRWKLEVYRQRFPHQPLADRHRQIRLFTGNKGGLEELRALFSQAQALAALLIEWNRQFGVCETQHFGKPELLAAAAD